MAIALEQFLKQLTDSGVIAPGKLEAFVPPKAQPKDAQELARQLVQSKHLTKFQAQEIYQGRAKTLILGNYTILEKLGAGGMGQVFKAEHRRMKRIVAIKVLPKTLMKDATAAARFQREVEAAAKLNHPHIVTAYDADEAGGVHFLVMEYVEGSDLFELVKKNGPLSVTKAVNCILQAARGLEFAHNEGVVHRDIKPANLLLDKKGTVKILDMGLARIDAGGDASTRAELTGTGAVMGTVDYMAPEQALSTKNADARADVYSLGCSLYYLLTGKATYDGDTLMAKLLAHREQPIPVLGANVPDEVNSVFRKMVAKRIEDRFQTMNDVVAAFETCRSRQQTTVSTQPSITNHDDTDVMAFLRDASALTTHKSKPFGTTALTAPRKRNMMSVLVASGVGLLGLMILAGIVFKMQTKDGTLVVEVNQPDAVVHVLNEEGKVEITQPGENRTLSISVDPGKHRLKVEKDGFKFFAKEFEMEPGATLSIKATLEPLKSVAEEPKNPRNSSTFQQWTKDVAALPAEKQVVAVVKKLQELNPRFDGKETHDIEDGAVTSLSFDAGDVTEISPVRALTGLKNLKCAGTEKGSLSDLSPLKGMHLTKLVCDFTEVSDLSPLKGVLLTELDCGVTQVSNLSPLKEMHLTRLNCGSTHVSDLSPLKGMALTILFCDNSDVSDLSPLKGMPLTILLCYNTKVSDLSPLEGMPLTSLSCDGTQVSDLSPLHGMNLTRIAFTPSNITKGMDVVRQMKSLKTIGITGRIEDRLSSDQFWKKYDAGDFGTPNLH